MRGNGALLEEDGTEIMDVQYDVMNVADRIPVGGGQTIEGSNQFLGTVKRADKSRPYPTGRMVLLQIEDGQVLKVMILGVSGRFKASGTFYRL